MNYFEGLEFFLFLLIVLCGGFVLNFFGKKKEVYILAISLIFAGTIYGQSKKNGCLPRGVYHLSISSCDAV